MAYTREDQDPKIRAQSLKESIARMSADPKNVLGANYDPNLARDIAGMQAELGSVQDLINQSQIDQNLALFDRYSPQVDESSDRAAIAELFQTRRGQEMNALNEMFNQQRGQAIEEAAATGNLRQPAFAASQLNNIDALKAKAVQALFAELGIGENTALLDRTAQNRELGFNKARVAAGIRQGGQQFGDELAFGRDQFNTTMGLKRRDQDLDDLFRRDQLNLQRSMFEESQPSGFDKNLARAGNVVGIAKNITGIGKDIFGGVGPEAGKKRTGGLF